MSLSKTLGGSSIELRVKVVENIEGGDGGR